MEAAVDEVPLRKSVPSESSASFIGNLWRPDEDDQPFLDRLRVRGRNTLRPDWDLHPFSSWLHKPTSGHCAAMNRAACSGATASCQTRPREEIVPALHGPAVIAAR